MGPKSEKYANLCSHYISNGAEVHTLFTFWTHLYSKRYWPGILVLHNRFSLGSKTRDSIIFWIIWRILLQQHSILHDLFTIGVNGKTSWGWILPLPTVWCKAVLLTANIPIRFYFLYYRTWKWWALSCFNTEENSWYTLKEVWKSDRIWIYF